MPDFEPEQLVLSDEDYSSTQLKCRDQHQSQMIKVSKSKKHCLSSFTEQDGRPYSLF